MMATDQITGRTGGDTTGGRIGVRGGSALPLLCKEKASENKVGVAWI